MKSRPSNTRMQPRASLPCPGDTEAVAPPPPIAFGRGDVATLRSWLSPHTPLWPLPPVAYKLGPRGGYLPNIRVLYDRGASERAATLRNRTLPPGMLGSLVEPCSAVRRAKAGRGGSPSHIQGHAEALLPC